MLHIKDLTYRIGGRTLLDAATVHISAGQRVGLIGRNGAGKTTLFKLILGELHTDGGSIAVRPRATIGRVEQEMAEGDETLVECVLAHDPERTALLAEAEESQCGDRLSELHERLNAIDAHTAPARAASILAGLGFDADAQNQPLRNFSGGWRMRVALAGALFATPELLMLDEPTNHLDLEATLWLQNYLASYPGTLLVISHDRELLNIVADRILHIDQQKLVSYGGNYDRFEQVRREKAELAGKAAVKQGEQRKKLQAFVDRFRAKASKAKQAQSRVKMLERLGPPISIIEERTMSFDFPNPDQLAPPVIAIDDGVAGYGPGKVILRKLDLRIDMDDRIALLGANGNGKSTLAKVLAGRLELMEGKVQKQGKLRIAYFAQHQAEELRLNETPFEHMAQLMEGSPPSKVRAQLGRFGFEQDRANIKVGNLSGGEKARLLFALMSRDAPHIMILDEPTNHLDIEAREALVRALNEYEGAVILISHDPHMIELAADRLWLVDRGEVHAFEGDLDAYRKLLLDRAREARREGREPRESNANRKEERRAAADKRKQQAPLRNAVQEAEKKVDALGKRKADLAAKIADPKIYNGPADAVTSLKRELADLERTLARAEEAWVKANEALEAAEQG